MTFNSNQEQQIIDLYNQGVTYKEISAKIGTSKSSVFRYIQKLKGEGKITVNRTTSRDTIQNQSAQILNMYNLGLSYNEMAEKLGVSVSIIESRITELRRKKILKKARHPRTNPHMLNKQYKLITILYNNGFTRNEMAEMLGISISDIANRIAFLRKKGMITTYNKPGPKNNASRILDFEKKILQNKYPKDEVHILANLYILEGLYKDAVMLLDCYIKYNNLSEQELELISQIKSKLQTRILNKGKER